MKKQATKKGWLLGLLVGLVMIIGATPAMAGSYSLVADIGICGNTIDDVYYYDKSNNFFIDGIPVEYYDKFEDSTFVSLEATGSTYTSTGSLSGSWDSNGENIQFFIVKGGNCANGKGYIALYGWDSSDKTSGSFDLSGLNLGTDKKGRQIIPADVSHIDLYAVAGGGGGSSVPIPGAVWLLGSGLSALLIARRRRK